MCNVQRDPNTGSRTRTHTYKHRHFKHVLAHSNALDSGGVDDNAMNTYTHSPSSHICCCCRRRRQRRRSTSAPNTRSKHTFQCEAAGWLLVDKHTHTSCLPARIVCVCVSVEPCCCTLRVLRRTVHGKMQINYLTTCMRVYARTGEARALVCRPTTGSFGTATCHQCGCCAR